MHREKQYLFVDYLVFINTESLTQTLLVLRSKKRILKIIDKVHIIPWINTVDKDFALCWTIDKIIIIIALRLCTLR